MPRQVGGRKPTLADVARLAGVASVTVSRVLNEPDVVTADTLAKVRKAIASLGYQVNPAARALAGSRWGSVGVVVPSLDHIMFPRQLRVFEQVMSGMDVAVMISATNYDADQEAGIVRKLVGRGVDGILLTHLEQPDRVFDLLREQRVPSVMMGSRSQAPAENWIAYDDFGAMEQLVDLLYDLGHRRIGMIADSRAKLNSEGRVGAVLRRLEFYGIPIPADWLMGCGVAEVGDAFDQLMAKTIRPTAIICGNDWLALEVISRAELRGLKLPLDLSVTGFDDIDMARHPAISLTTVVPPWQELGQQAAQAMLNAIAIAIADDAAQQILLPAKIVVRNSVGSPSS